ncbi:MAG: glycosyltransferase family 2 protein [Aquificaceae bacterium]
MVSVIIPVYNGERLISRAIASALNQTWKDLEIIVVDDCSTDRTKEIVFSEFGNLMDSKILYLRNHRNMERSFSRNRGFDVSNGKYVFFLDYDDEWEEDYIESSLKHLEEYHIVYCAPRTFIDENSKPIKVSKKHISEDAEKLIFSGYIGYPSASAFRREAFLRYREDMVGREDWEIYIRSYLSGLKIKVFDVNKVKIREHRSRRSKNMNMLFATMKVFGEYKDKVPANCKKDFLFHIADMNLRFGDLPFGWKLFLKSLSASTLTDWRKLFSVFKRGFRLDKYIRYLHTKNH